MAENSPPSRLDDGSTSKKPVSLLENRPGRKKTASIDLHEISGLGRLFRYASSCLSPKTCYLARNLRKRWSVSILDAISVSSPKPTRRLGKSAKMTPRMQRYVSYYFHSVPDSQTRDQILLLFRVWICGPVYLNKCTLSPTDRRPSVLSANAKTPENRGLFSGV